MRDRLIELIGKELLDYASWSTEMALAGNYDMPSVEEVIADKILKDGWFRPPCKVGDWVYLLDNKQKDMRYEAQITDIHIDEKTIWFEWVQLDISYELTEVWDDGEFDIDDIGKTVFLSLDELEEAEQALKGGGKE